MKFPIDIVFNELKPGIVFSYRNEEFEGRGKFIPHFYVLLNTPKENKECLLLMVHATSKSERFKGIEKYELPGTLIYVKKGEYNFLEKEISVFDCNIVTAMMKEKFAEKYNNDQIIFVEENISSSIVLKLQQGVLRSRKVSERYKKIIMKEIKN